MNRFSNLSIKLKLFFSIFVLLIVTLGIFVTFIMIEEYKGSYRELRKESNLRATMISNFILSSVLLSDKTGVENILSKLKDVENISTVFVYNQKGERFAAYTKKRNSMASVSKHDLTLDSYKIVDDEAVLSKSILYDKTKIGSLVMYISTKQIDARLKEHTVFLILIAFALSLLSLLLIFLIQSYITAPIINLAHIAQEITLSENYTIRAQKVHKDEVGQLYDAFNTMLEKIQHNIRERDEAESISRTYQAHLERITNELEERVKERTIALQDSLTRLQGAQGQLIEAGKMAGLGGLVAGVAHEVNTPLGISITAASVFKNEIKKIQTMLGESKLTQKSLESFLETIEEADQILTKNLERAALLIRNFKKISVDQSSEGIRDFELNSYMQEVLITFKSELKYRPVALEIKFIDKAIHMHSYPGAISQIIVNMIQNSLTHGFDNEQEGKIIIQTKKIDDKVELIFCDTGKGVAEDVIDTIFEPFVTTKRNTGGTGLGLNITYNLVIQQLGGTIRLDREHEGGACFIIEIPCKCVHKGEH